MSTSLLRNRDYVLLWGGQTISAAGSQVSGFVLPLLALQLSGSAAQAGFVGAFGGLPAVVLSLSAGALADRWDRKRLMILCDAGRALNMLSIPVALALGRLGLRQLYFVALVEGMLFVFFNIAETAALPRVVAPEDLPAATGQSEMTWGFSALVGPSVGGILYGLCTYALPFLADAEWHINLAHFLRRKQHWGPRFQTPPVQTISPRSRRTTDDDESSQNLPASGMGASIIVG